MTRKCVQPLGVVGFISAFNFPVAVWAWNSALAAVCGDSTLWKPSEKTPLTAIATIKIAEKVCRANKVDPAIFSLIVGHQKNVGERVAAHMHAAGHHPVGLTSIESTKKIWPEVAETKALFANAKTVRQAMIASLIFGPPKAFEN